MNIYIIERKTLEGKTTFNTYKTRNKAGKWLDVKFTDKAGKPQPYFTRGTAEYKKGYVVIEVVDGNITPKKDVVTKDGELVYVMWVNEFQTSPATAQEEFKTHIEVLAAEFNAEKNKIYQEFING